MSVTDAKDKRGNTVAGARLRECLDGLEILRICATESKHAHSY